jgi:hypothetical protein
MIVTMGIIGVAAIGLALLSDREVIRIDMITMNIVTYLGLGGIGLYLIYQLGKVFLLF